MTDLEDARDHLRAASTYEPAVLTVEQAKAVESVLELAEKAPHDFYCDMEWADRVQSYTLPCNCWKSRL